MALALSGGSLVRNGNALAKSCGGGGPPQIGSCCFTDDITQARACVEGVDSDWCSNRTDSIWHPDKSCSEVDCSEVWWVNCYANGTNPTADCFSCGFGPFGSYAEANQWVIDNPPPDGCDLTIVGGTPRKNPLP